MTVENLDAGKVSEIFATYLVGCDGAHSDVRHVMGARGSRKIQGSAFVQFARAIRLDSLASNGWCSARLWCTSVYDCAMTTTPDDPNVPSATPEVLLHKIGTLWILFGAMITSLGNDDPNLIDRMLTVLEHTNPIGMFSEDALADALHFVRGLVKRPL